MENKDTLGITLIALVVTIVVILILAGVCISMITGDSDIVKQTQNAKEKYENSTAEELAKLELINIQMKNSEYTNSQKAVKLLEKLKENDPNASVSLNTDGTYEVFYKEESFVIGTVTNATKTEEQIDSTYIKIKTEEDLRKIGEDDNYPLDGKYILVNNITLGNVNNDGYWDCISYRQPFTGELDGNNYTIEGLKMEGTGQYTTTGSYYGLFATISGATIKNLNINGVVTENTTRGGTGIIVGQATNNSTIKNCKITAGTEENPVTGKVVGICYDLNNSNIEDCVVNIYSDASSLNYIGGITAIASNEAKISNCVIKGKIKSTDYVGGIVGTVNKVNIENCISYCSIETTGNYIGGIAGYAYGGSSIINCHKEANITGNEDIGGIVGKNENTYINNCSYKGKLEGTEDVGGIIGYALNNTKINNSFVIGNVIGTSYVGGLIGFISGSNGEMKNCYINSNVPTTGNYIGRVIGQNSIGYDEFVISNVYYSNETTGVEVSTRRWK